ncbi:lanthionine synthetase C family protein [Streptomyces sp. SP17BM10]|uniref:lanthionine synthetase C family protein n=1 Tax=Streptomyces sp. SP17BM10 TaxID=3002530 RepID=UPI002E75C330|nr:lanthionine synthetase C family protein [Streptomyces sp. SP17BM10]MEE1788783.1 lanthionine synthetase C family protein [Streptomyces sp. SP17BM10]
MIGHLGRAGGTHEQLPEPAEFGETAAGVAAFVAAVADPARSTLFPTDPFAHITNPLSLGFGASGVLWALDASGVPLRPGWREWLRERLDAVDPSTYPGGLMNGLAGLAWASDELGFRGQARTLLALANRRAAETGDHTFYYGLAGVGLTNLRFYVRGHDERDLAAALDCARALHGTARRDGRLAYWINEFSPDGPLAGLGFGQAGVAVFLLRTYQVTGDEVHLELGRAALAWELAQARLVDGIPMFEHDGTLEPYVEVGSAGIAKVLLRYGDLDDARAVLRALDAGRSVLPGYGFGAAGIADALLDAAEITGDPVYRRAALRRLDHARSAFLVEPVEWAGLPRGDGPAPLGVPGEGLLRCACDYLTGSAGVLRVLHRAQHGCSADFLLDEVSR